MAVPEARIARRRARSTSSMRLQGAVTDARGWLRARPRLQGTVLSPAGVGYQLPHAADGLYVLLYHDVTPDQLPGFRRQLVTLMTRGTFLAWDEAMQGVCGDRPLTGPHFSLTFDDAHKSWAGIVLDLLQELGLPATFFITTGRVVAGPCTERLTWDDCARLTGAGMHIGSHTVTHRRLSELDRASVCRELIDSRAELEQQLGLPVLDFAAPYGVPGEDYGRRELLLADEAGYHTCSSALSGRMEPGHSAWDLRRCGISPAWPMLAVRKRVHE